jgi:Tfp pilus assembly ATPase PilU
MSFLEYLVTWSQAEGFATATLDRSVEESSQSMEVRGRLARHQDPSQQLLDLALELSALVSQRIPAHAATLDLLGRTLHARR